MKTQRLFVLALIFVLVLAITIPMAAAAGDSEVPFKATYQGVPVGIYDPECNCLHQTYEFDGVATHLGESHLSATGQTILVPPFPVSGSGTLIAGNGDLLYWKYEGFGVFLPSGDVTYSGSFSITGGTGRFVGVNGAGTYSGSATPGVWGIIKLDGKLIK
jgi:hypothetical protein